MALVQAETENELLLVAGHGTTVNLIGNGTLALWEHPDQRQRRSDHPELLACAVEEVLRCHRPVEKFGPRIALEEVEFSGQRIPKGSDILLGLALANRDEAVFENPDQLDIARTPNRHLAFGMGIHFCLGAPLARLEGRIAIQTLVQRFPHMQLAIPFEEVKWRKSTMLHGLRFLPLRLQERGGEQWKIIRWKSSSVHPRQIVLSSPTEGPWFGSLSIKDAHMWSCTFCANVSDGNASVMPSS